MLHYFSADLDQILDLTKSCWSEKKNKTIFISGGTGFFGIWLQMSFIYINRKLNLNSKLILLTRDKDKFLSKFPWINDCHEVKFVEGDINNFVFIDESIDYLIHVATDASVSLNIEKPLIMFETVVNGTKRILEFARLKGVKSFLFTSSGAVYGKQPSDLRHITEDYLGAPIANDCTAVYGEGKKMGEVLCAVYNKHYNLPVKIARCYAFSGPFLPLDGHFAFGNFIKNVLDGNDIIIEGDGTPYRSYMYASDLMVWLWTILFKGKSNYPYNVGSHEEITIEELARLVVRVSGKHETKIKIRSEKCNDKPLRYVPSINRAETELNLKLYTSLSDSIQKTLQFNRSYA
jgi:dTDP-glucose 4,6-dehydratase